MVERKKITVDERREEELRKRRLLREAREVTPGPRRRSLTGTRVRVSVR